MWGSGGPVALRKSSYPSLPQFPHLYYGDNDLFEPSAGRSRHVIDIIADFQPVLQQAVFSFPTSLHIFPFCLACLEHYSELISFQTATLKGPLILP